MRTAFEIAADILDPPDGFAREKLPWRDLARPEQLPPEDWERIWYIQGGRGSGKTRTAAESFAELIRKHLDRDWGVVAPSFGEARDVCIEGPSGLKRALGPDCLNWNRSLGEMNLRQGGKVFIDGADDGATSIQGKNLAGVWGDEVGKWRGGRKGTRARPWWEVAWDESIAFAVRFEPALIIASGTPKAGHPLVKRLVADPLVPKSRLRLEDNVENLSPAAVAELKRRYEGTRLGRQELEGELIEDIEGALWSWEMIEPFRLPDEKREEMPRLRRIVVAVDPSWGTMGDECGIIVAGRGVDNRAYVLDDRSLRATPEQWGNVVKDAYTTWKADRIVAEVNFQAEQVRLVMQTVDRKLSFKPMRASRGKQVRAEPVVALYEQGRVSHVGSFGGLEQQMTEWVPEEADFSPDRVDALVWALTELMLDAGGPAKIDTGASRSLPRVAP